MPIAQGYAAVAKPAPKAKAKAPHQGQLSKLVGKLNSMKAKYNAKVAAKAKAAAASKAVKAKPAIKVAAKPVAAPKKPK